MTYTSLATPVPNTKILVSSFGALVKQDLDDHESRMLSAESRLTTLETPFRADCAFYIPGATGVNLLATNGATLATGWTPIPPAVSYPGLISHSAGVFTLNKTGFWGFGVYFRWDTGATDFYSMICGASAAEVWAKNSTSSAINSGISMPARRYVSGQTVRTYAYSGAARNIRRESTNDLVPAFYATYLGS